MFIQFPFVISFWYCFLTSGLCMFLRVNLFQSNFCLLTAIFSLTFAAICQWSFTTQSYPLKNSTLSILDCSLRYVSLWSVWLGDYPSVELKVYLWMFRCGSIVLLTTSSFWFVKVYYSNAIVITNLMWTFFPDCPFENIVSPHFCIKISY
jgi:hypothetical protein